MSQSEDFKKLFVRDLERLKSEIESYEDESHMWLKSGEIKNSAGSLALHLCGNLKHFIGATLLGDGYVRDRQFEFSGHVDRKSLIKNIEETIVTLESYFDLVDSNQFLATYPIEVFKHPMTVFYFLVHLQGHLNYHLGQINYHRRLIEK